MWNRPFWISAIERAVRACAWAMLSVLIVGDGILDAFDANWLEALGVGVGAAVASLLASLAASGTGDPDSPSFVDEPGRHAAP